jgi:hypothetical protein
MSRTRTLGVLLVAVIATFLAVASASASAQAPEFGTCRHVPGKAGAWGNPGCTTAGGTKANQYEWQQENETGKRYTFDLKPKTVAKFETVHGAAILCTGEIGNGWNESFSTAGLEIRFTGCSSEGFACQSLEQAKGTIYADARRNLGWISHSELEVGDALLLDGEGAPFECDGGVFAERQFLGGAGVSPVKAGVMVSKETVKFSEKSGVQIPTGVEESRYAFRFCTYSTCTQAALKASFIETNEQKFEINPII